MELGTILSIIKVSLEVFQDERKNRFLKKYAEIEKDWMDEMSKNDDDRSDLELDRLLFSANNLAKLIVAESNSK